MLASSIEADAARLRMVLARVARRLRREAGGDLSPTLGAALSTIEAHQPITPGELAERELVRPPTVTRIVAQLEARGLIAKVTDAADRRSSLISLTPRGAAALAELRSRGAVFLAEQLRALSAEELAALRVAADVLERIVAPTEGGR